MLTNWFIVGCSQPVVIAFTVAMASSPPAAPRQCPIIDWRHTGESTSKKVFLSISMKRETSQTVPYGTENYLGCIDFDL